MKTTFTVTFILLTSFIGLQRNYAQGFTGNYDPATWFSFPTGPLDQVIAWDSSHLEFQVAQGLTLGGAPYIQVPCASQLSFNWSTTGIFNPSDYLLEVVVGSTSYYLNTFPPGQFGPVPISSFEPIQIHFIKFYPMSPPGHFTITNFNVISTDTIPPVALMPADTSLFADSGECCTSYDYLPGPSAVFYQHNYSMVSNFTFLNNDGSNFVSENIMIYPSQNIIFTGISVLEKVCYPLPSSVEIALFKEGDPDPIIFQEVIDSANYDMVLDQVTPSGDSLYRFTFSIPNVLFTSTSTMLRVAVQGNGAGCFQWVTDDQPENDLNCFSYLGPIATADWGAMSFINNEPIIRVEHKPLSNLFSDSECGIASVTITEGFFPGSCFPVGVTHNVFIGTDNAGNSTTASFNINVSGTVPPVPQLDSLPILFGLCETFVTTPPLANNGCNINTYAGTTTDPLHYSDPGIYTVHWTYTDDDGNTSTQEQTVLVAVEDCVGIEEENETLLNIFPNPNNGSFSISFDNESPKGLSLQVINNLGQVMYSSPINNQVEQFNLNHLAGGTYYILIDGNKHQTRQLVIIH